MLASAFLTPLLLLVSLLSGYLIVPYLRLRHEASRMGIALLMGLAIVVVALSWLGAFWGSKQYGWGLFFALLVLPLMLPASRRALIEDFRRAACNHWFWISGIIAMLIVGFLNAPNFLPGAPVVFEAGHNHDVLHWVGSAHALQEQGYLVPNVQPGMRGRIFEQFAGWWTWDGRLGSELLLAWLSTLLGVHPALAYNALAASFLIPWTAAVFVLAEGMRGRAVPRWTVVMLIPLQAAFVFYYGNGNLPNLFGVILAGGTAWLMCLTVRHPIRPGWPNYVAAALGVNAIFAVYPELLPFLLPALVVAVLVDGRDIGLRPASMFLIAVALLAVLWNPVNVVRGIGTVWLKSRAPTMDLPLSGIFSQLKPSEWIPAWITMDPHLVVSMGEPLWAVLASLAIVLIAALGLCTSRNRGLASVGIFIAALLTAFAVLRGFDYAHQKAIQSSGIFLYALIFIGFLGSLEFRSVSLSGVIARSATVISAFVFLAAFVHQAFAALERSAQKHVPHDLFGPQAFAHGQASSVLVLDNGFRESYFYGAWLPYVMNAVQAELPVSPDQPRWYQPENTAVSAPDPEYLLTEARLENRIFRILDDPLYVDDVVVLYRNELGGIQTFGVGLRHGDRCPIVGESLLIRLGAGRGWVVTVAVSSDEGSEPVRFVVNGESFLCDTEAGVARVSLPLSGLEGNEVEIFPPVESDATWWLTELTFEKVAKPIPARMEGAHPWEGSFRWISESLVVTPLTHTSGWLNIRMLHQYHHLSPNNVLLVQLGDRSRVVDLEELRLGVSLRWDPEDKAPIILRSAEGALSPRDEGESDDERPLSIAFSTLEFASTPLFSPVLWNSTADPE